MKFIIMAIAIALLSSCTSEKDARHALDIDGVTDVKMTGYKWFSCSKDDWYHTGFSGIRNGKNIEGVVCSGLLFKSATIRY